MTVDLEAIARRGLCEVSSLRNALPLLQQGYSPPFLARYRRDELSGVDEASLWALSAAVSAEQAVAAEREHLLALWEATPLSDSAIAHAIRKSNSKRMLERLTRRLKLESADSASFSDHLAVRLMNPRKGDGADIAAIVTKVDAINEGDASAAIEGLDKALAKRLAGDPRVINAAVKWLSKNAKIKVVNISDPHTPGTDKEEAKSAEDSKADSPSSQQKSMDNEVACPAEQKHDQANAAELQATEQASTEKPPSEPEPIGEPETKSETEPQQSDTSTPASADQEHADESSLPEMLTAEVESTPSTVAGDSSDDSVSPESVSPESVSPESAATTPRESATKKPKKMSPRQRRRRWLVSVLKPLAGKRFAANKLSSFQVVMLGRALRSHVAQCSFEYDAAKLVAEIQRTVTGINRQIESKLRDIVIEHEANIREAAEAAWWDELHERASSRLVGIVADHLRAHINRGCVDAKVVMSIDAVGPRTAAASIVSNDGRVLHCEDLPCQLSSALRSQAVARMGELIHQYHVDLIVISNGPARRGCMIALSDLIGQSPEKSIRWTLADRTGADVYAGSDVANQEMRTTPRRFRAAAWLAFSVLQPAQAFAKVDPLKLRLASFQRELSDESVAETLESVIVSGASRGGVDVNSASCEWLGRLPGMTPALAGAIDSHRRESLLKSRKELLELDAWQSVVESRQALPFLRVFGSEEPLDGTLIHPDDYPLAKKLAKSLEIELPPAMPPGYQPPTFESESPATAEPALSETPKTDEKPEVEDLTAVVEKKAATGSFAENVEAESAEPANEELADSAESTEPAVEPAPSSESTESDKEAEPAESEATEETTAVEATEAVVESEATGAEPSNEAAATAAEAVAAQAAPESVRRPRPDQTKIDKNIKEWMIGARRANQLVSWLCDPFGDSDISGRPPAVLTTMPSQKSLGPGDEVIGVVVGVMPFGVFVELAPDCSGLIHISKISDKYVEDLHEAIQVGDVITAWVTGIDPKKRRVALSAVSPEREAELQQQRQQQPRGKGGRPQRAGAQRGGEPQRGGDPRSRDAGKPAGQARGRGSGQDRSRGRSSGDRGRGRDQRRGRKEKKPESYRVVGKAESAPISDAMKKGEEPLRSFGDLLQYYSKEEDAQQATSQQAANTPDTNLGTPETLAIPPADSAPAADGPAAPQPESTPPQDLAPTADAAAAETPQQADSAPNTDVPAADAPATDAPTTDAPTTDVPAADVPATDVPATDVPATDVPAAETPQQADSSPTADAPASASPQQPDSGEPGAPGAQITETAESDAKKAGDDEATELPTSPDTPAS